MTIRRILLYEIDGIMLIVAHPSGAIYRNQVGGVVNFQGELEGLLCPLDVLPTASERIQNCPYPSGRQGITSSIADEIDAVLAAESRTSFITVDRPRLQDSWEAWVHVLINTPESGTPAISDSYGGPVFGFGASKGVLTWPNSD